MKRKLTTLTALLTLFSVTYPAFAEPPAAAIEQAASIAGQVDDPDVFGSIALPLSRSRYDDRWRRVASPDEGALPGFARQAQWLDPRRKVATINAAMNQRVRYQSDAPRDNWATAGETMRRMAGDCEDIAIAKMQALIALGVPAASLYMSIGHDSAANAVHAILLVRMDQRFWVLDNRVDRLIPQEAFGQFYPILTFSGSRTWLHGYRGGIPLAVKSLSFAAASGRMQVGGESWARVRAHS